MKNCEYEKWPNGAASPLSLWAPLSRNEDNGRSPFNENPAKNTAALQSARLGKVRAAGNVRISLFCCYF